MRRENNLKKNRQDVVIDRDDRGRLCLFSPDRDFCVYADFDSPAMQRRIKGNQVYSELIIRAAGRKNHVAAAGSLAVDMTAGLGEDGFLLAAAGFRVILFERDPIIFCLLRDAAERAAKIPQLRDIVGRMTLIEGDSTSRDNKWDEGVDVVFLDPMFPGKKKKSLTKKKFQLIHHLEQPCPPEEERRLLDAAYAAAPERIIIKRPVKGPCFCGKNPSFSLAGKAVRYDVLL